MPVIGFLNGASPEGYALMNHVAKVAMACQLRVEGSNTSQNAV
jgi:hypothetical protein